MNLFIDLDGVLSGFDEYFIDQFEMTPRHISDEKLWELIDNLSTFWLDIIPKYDAYVLWNFVQKFNPIILTGCPRTNYDIAAEHKGKWVQKYFGNNVQVITCLSKNKYTYIKDYNDILIDDMYKNIKKWEKYGGQGILHKNAISTIEKLKSMLIH